MRRSNKENYHPHQRELEVGEEVRRKNERNDAAQQVWRETYFSSDQLGTNRIILSIMLPDNCTIKTENIWLCSLREWS